MKEQNLLRCLNEFVDGARSISSLEECLGSNARLRFWDTNQRDVHLAGRLPQVLFSREQVDAELRRFLAGELSARDLSDWAAAIRLLGCFDVNEEDPGSSEVWDFLDELMSPDAWGPITVESVLDLRRRLNAPEVP